MLSCSNLFVLENSCYRRPSWCAAALHLPSSPGSPEPLTSAGATCWAGPLPHNRLACFYCRRGKAHKQPRSTRGDASKRWRATPDPPPAPPQQPSASSRWRHGSALTAGWQESAARLFFNGSGRNWTGSSWRNYTVSLCPNKHATRSPPQKHTKKCKYGSTEPWKREQSYQDHHQASCEGQIDEWNRNLRLTSVDSAFS